MFYRKKINYPGRWFVKLVEVGLIFGIIVFGIDALNKFFTPTELVEDSSFVIETQPSYYTIVVPQNQSQQDQVFNDYDYHEMALVHQLNGEYFDAAQDYTRALEINTNRPNSRLNRGVAYEQLGHAERAMYDFNVFLNRDDVTRISANMMDADYEVQIPMADGRVYEFPFYAIAGQTFSVSVTSEQTDEVGAVDPLIVIMDDNGQPIAAADDILRQDGSYISMNSVLENVTVPVSGRYTLRVSHAGGNPYGGLNVDFQLQDGMAKTDCYEGQEGR